MLELLPSKGRNGINQFLNHLSTHYSWIAGHLQDSITNKYNVKFSKKIQETLTAGEVPQLSSRHVSRVKHVCIVYTLSDVNLCYYIFGL